MVPKRTETTPAQYSAVSRNCPLSAVSQNKHLSPLSAVSPVRSVSMNSPLISWGRSSWRVRAGSKAGVLACWIRGHKHLTIGALASHVRFIRFLRARFACTVGLLKSSWWEVNSSKQRCAGQEWSPFTWVPLLRGVSQHSCVWGSVWVWQPVH